MRHFGSVEKIAEAEVADLLEVEEMNIPAAEAVYAFFRGIDIEKEKSAAQSELKECGYVFGINQEIFGTF